MTAIELFQNLKAVDSNFFPLDISKLV